MGVYLSYPFCAQKCTYCNFASGVLPRALEPRYIEALRAEIHAAAWPWTPETVYLGGGTPSTMDAGGLAALLASIPGKPWKEAAIEAAPGTLTPERAAAWTAAGINRVSLGVQSFNTAELRRTGRRHTAETVASDVALLRAAGIGAISCDLIAGLPAQTVESWEESLDWIARLDIPHVSVYMLEVDEDSRLGREMLLGGVRYGAAETPDEDAIVACYTRAIERLARLGLERYEISNFARPGCESLHNLKYWRLEPYLGFGSDAHSFDGRVRWQNVETAQEYVECFARGQSARTAAAPAVQQEERFFVGLRLAAGIVPRAEDWDRFSTPIRRFLREGLLEESGGRLRLTDRGVLVSNDVLEEFVGT